jgi:tRNA nucleotidyltransferase (CCA-adding enzyme)
MPMSEESRILPKDKKARLEGVVKAVLEEVKPTKTELEQTKHAINLIMERLKLVTPKNVEIILAGSVARGTQVRGNFDIDIFLLFPRSLDEKVMEKKGLEIAKRVIKNKDESYSIKYAEHPYTKLTFGKLGVDVEIVPAYKITDIKDKGTSVDRTPLHNEFISSKLSERQRDDVRVLKTFLNSYGIYGAEARIEGFSGYLCELLISHFGSFASFVCAAANVKLPMAIDALNKKEYASSSKEAKELACKFSRQFIVLDPTDANRNVAANVSDESLSRLAIASRALIKAPSKRTFYSTGYSDALSKDKIAKIRSNLGLDLHLISFKLPDMAEDITWQQLKRLNSRLADLLKANRFEPMLALQNIDGTDGIIAFFINPVVFKSRIVKGPSVIMGSAYDKFVKSHGKASLLSLDKERVYSLEPAKYKTPHELLHSVISNPKDMMPSYLKSKTAKVYLNDIPEQYAKMLYRAYVEKSVTS